MKEEYFQLDQQHGIRISLTGKDVKEIKSFATFEEIFKTNPETNMIDPFKFEIGNKYPPLHMTISIGKFSEDCIFDTLLKYRDSDSIKSSRRRQEDKATIKEAFYYFWRRSLTGHICMPFRQTATTVNFDDDRPGKKKQVFDTTQSNVSIILNSTKNRNYHEIDIENLKRLMKMLNYRYEIWENLSLEEFNTKIDSLQIDSLKSLTFYVMSHGNYQGFVLKDMNSYIKYTDFLFTITKKKKLKNLDIPMIFFFQTCRSATDDASKVRPLQEFSHSLHPFTTNNKTDEENIFEGYASVKYFPSFRTPYGTYYIRAIIICIILFRHKDNLEEIMEKVKKCMFGAEPRPFQIGKELELFKSIGFDHSSRKRRQTLCYAPHMPIEQDDKLKARQKWVTGVLAKILISHDGVKKKFRIETKMGPFIRAVGELLLVGE
ncbi:DgyrCDS14655 [Dimorphilus gyrociliatus]|uniref:DgyrCDS14655 n=1 Tax=Dimorphilus gyrociliatus TaxID=2664684 RepID=A0A7I8WEF5_9ANNE|nr:DgyrCDS14655 [Dimorphilus gyrociliatus]